MKNSKNIYENILGEIKIMNEEKVEFGEKIKYMVTSPDKTEPYEIEHIYGQALPLEIFAEELELTKGKRDFITKAKLLGEDAIKENLGFYISDIQEEREKGRLITRLTKNLKGIDGDLVKLVIPDFITSVGILNNYFNIIGQLEIGENLRNMHFLDGLIVENIKLSDKNKYYKLKNGNLYTYTDELVLQAGYDHLEI